MNQHKRVILDTLDHLYARVPNPSISDRERHRIARLAVDRLAPEHEPANLGGMTVAQVQSLVEGGEVSVREALNFERANAGRKSLIAWLEERE